MFCANIVDVSECSRLIDEGFPASSLGSSSKLGQCDLWVGSDGYDLGEITKVSLWTCCPSNQRILFEIRTEGTYFPSRYC